MSTDSFAQRKPFFLVWCASTGKTFFRHKNVESAEKEADRLSKLNLNVKFHVLMALGRCVYKEENKNPLDISE